MCVQAKNRGDTLFVLSLRSPLFPDRLAKIVGGGRDLGFKLCTECYKLAAIWLEWFVVVWGFWRDVSMPRFRATVRVDGLQGDDPHAVRDSLKAKLATLDIAGRSVVSIAPARRVGRRAVPQVALAPAEGAWRKQSNAAGLLLLGAIGLAVWVFWSMWALYSVPVTI